MRKHRGVTVLTALATVLLTAPGASAATEVGSNCNANALIVGATIFPLVNGSGSLPASIPVAGVATVWRVNTSNPDTHAERLKVLRPTPDPQELQVVAESSLQNVSGSQNSFDTRIPVEPGDRLAVSGRTGGGAIACSASSGDVAGIFFSEPPLGSNAFFTEENNYQAAVSAIIEPDSDGDGYGDETQDGCPRAAAFQADCPVVALSANGKARKRSVLVRVGARAEASVVVLGQVGWNFQSKRKPKAGKSKPRRLIVGLRGGTKTVLPGETANFTIRLPKAVLRRLGRIAPSESLKAKIAVRATDLAGRISGLRLTVRLKGRNRG